MGEARRRKLAGSGHKPPKYPNIREVPIWNSGVIGGRIDSRRLSAMALMMSMTNDFLPLPIIRGRGQHK